MRLRGDLRAVKGAVCAVGKQIEEKGAGADKTSAYASLVNAYCRLLAVRKKPSKLQDDLYLNGDPDFYESLNTAV